MLAADIGAVCADPGELQQALLNLCLNARDAMPSGGKLILKTERGRDLRGLLRRRAAVHDVPRDRYGLRHVAETQQRIFEPFYTTKEPARGPGWGWPTSMASSISMAARRACRKHRWEGNEVHPLSCQPSPRRAGDTGAQGQPPRGHKIEVRHKGGQNLPTSSLNGGVVRPGARKALIVDDEFHMRALISRWLSDEGFECLQAGGAPAACHCLHGAAASNW